MSKPTHKIKFVRQIDGRSIWRDLGVAWANDGGSFKLSFDVVPAHFDAGDIIVLPRRDDEIGRDR